MPLGLLLEVSRSIKSGILNEYLSSESLMARNSSEKIHEPLVERIAAMIKEECVHVKAKYCARKDIDVGNPPHSKILPDISELYLLSRERIQQKYRVRIEVESLRMIENGYFSCLVKS